MPGRDRTGPLGEGAMSGWGYGNCAGSNVRQAAPRPWRGSGMNARGSRWSNRAPGGYGWRNSYAATRRPVRMRAMRWRYADDAAPGNLPPDDLPIDKEALKQRMQALQSEMAVVNKQLDELEAAAEEEAAENDPL